MVFPLWCWFLLILNFHCAHLISVGPDPEYHSLSDLLQAKTFQVTQLGRSLTTELVEEVARTISLFRDNYETLIVNADDNELTPWNTNITTLCYESILEVLINIRYKETWALQLLDAAGRPEPGLLQGALLWMGSFGECRSIQAVVNNDTEFQGKYCMTTIGPAMNGTAPPPNPEGPSIAMALRLGLCFPDTCTDSDAFRLISTLFTIAREVANFTAVEVYSSVCQPESYEYDAKAIIALTFIGVFGFLIALGTLFDVVLYQRRLAEFQLTGIEAKITHNYAHGQMSHVEANNRIGSGNNVLNHCPENNQEEEGDDAPLLHPETTEATIRLETPEIGLCGEILMTFSIYTNFKKILSTNQSDQSLACVHGIRFFSMTWVLLGHCYAFSTYIIRDLIILPDVLGNFWFQAIVNASVSVDTFFTMSGMLVCYLFLLNYQKTKQIPIVGYYVHRYWRLTAMYGVIMLIYLSLFKFINTGPQWNPNGMEIDGCKNTWWPNLLYINNLFPTEKQCMGWTWYLANDMQFYWISPLILIPLVKFPVVGLGVLGTFFGAHIITTAVLTTHYNLPASMLGNGLTPQSTADIFLYFDKYYAKPWTRIGPYLIGMLCGYLLVKYRVEKIKLQRTVCAALWVCATVMALAVLYGLYNANNGHPLSPAACAIYNTLNRSAWALSVCWVIFACVQGYGGYVDTFLSWSAFVPLSRVTYCCYMIHLPLLMAFFMGKTSVIDFSHYEIIYFFFGTLIVTYGFAFLFTVGFESPLLALEKLVTRYTNKAKRSV